LRLPEQRIEGIRLSYCYNGRFKGLWMDKRHSPINYFMHLGFVMRINKKNPAGKQQDEIQTFSKGHTTSG
jgi:hypothetical protein